MIQGVPLLVIDGVVSYNSYKWPYKRVTGVTTTTSGVILVLITGRDPSCKDYQIVHDENPFRPPTNIWIWPCFFFVSHLPKLFQPAICVYVEMIMDATYLVHGT